MVAPAADTSFYWFDYETFGRHGALDRPAQFAGLRTDAQLQPIGDPLVIYCKPADDYLPEPGACLITGITPDHCLREGLPETTFISHIRAELAYPGTCQVGYNNIRFDDEFTRHTLFRNFFDPYEHEWKHGNSRWDLLDVVRLTRALRPDGINWPVNDDGRINNKLENLTALNGISHAHAHDALSDVHATIAVAQLIRERQPRLFDYVFAHRDKHSIAALLNLKQQAMVLHVSGMIPSDYLHTAVIMPLCRHPSNNNGILVYDLRHDPRPFFELSPDELALRLFSPRAELPDDMPRPPVKTVHINRCPVIVPLNTLDKAAQARTHISLADAENHAAQLRAHPSFAASLADAFAERTFDDVTDVDASLYAGGFFSANDKNAFARIHDTAPEGLGALDLYYDDPRIEEMLFRYRARNFPQTLDAQDKQHWETDRLARLNGHFPEGRLGAYLKELATLKQEQPNQSALLDALADYAQRLFNQSGMVEL
ncbi:MAG TPA: exodeoxyribonuclease I [Gammaproteobacteria bacterium]|jgi:exodeoxyribonuclease-1|nr:exodeoxyribonuclease I [Gammaproteobacteria bacterium]